MSVAGRSLDMKRQFKTGTFYYGDCFDVMSGIEAGSVDMILNDPPYGTTACSWDSVLPLDRVWAEYRRVAKLNGAIVMTASQPFTSMLVASNVSDFRHAWVWNKAKAANFPQVKRHPLKVHEDVLVFGSKKTAYFPQMRSGDIRKKGGYTTSNKDVAVMAGSPAVVNGSYYPKSILDFSIAKNLDAGLHPTQKPVALFEYLIRTYTNFGELVLDPTAGSGTTAIAAIQSGRRWICIERDQGYFEKACERVAKAEEAHP